MFVSNNFIFIFKLFRPNIGAFVVFCPWYNKFVIRLVFVGYGIPSLVTPHTTRLSALPFIGSWTRYACS